WPAAWPADEEPAAPDPRNPSTNFMMSMRVFFSLWIVANPEMERERPKSIADNAASAAVAHTRHNPVKIRTESCYF
ncbi:MAG: hypothetical protein RJQ21_05995, partial [Rhodospirillales bacterium]